MSQNSRKIILLLIISLVLLAVLPACSVLKDDVHLSMFPVDKLPAEIQSAPVTVQQAYQFAAANTDAMQNIPCYCGCGSIGHISNYDCYVAGTDNEGNISFDNHALGCSLCVDITQDVMRMSREGKSPQEARDYIDAAYSKYGPSNIP